MLKSIEPKVLALLRAIGRLAVGSPTANRATGGYGLACRGGLILLFLIGLALSWPVRGVGLAVMVVATLALLQYFFLQYRDTLLQPATMVWLVGVAAVLGAVMLVVWSRWPGRSGAKNDLVVLAVAFAGLAVLPFVRHLFRVIFGPHHPESALPEPEDSPPLWFWIGAVASDRATIVARVADETAADSVMVEYRSGARIESSASVPLGDHRLATVELTDLDHERLYDLRIQSRSGNRITGTVRGSFTTFPPESAPTTVSLAFASCMSTGSKGRVFDTIRETSPRPQMFVVTGDLHYENLTSDDPERFLETYDRVHASHAQRRLYNSMPMAYVWDDHDYGDNDSGHLSPSKQAAQTAYRMAVPNYIDQAKDAAIHQAFSIGRVRVVMTDNRSERGETPGQLLSSEAEEWLVSQIRDPQWPVVIWVSPTPWISDEDGSDNWGAYPNQRERIATAIGARSANLLMISGDAHMVAIDDGSNSAFAGPGSGFPVLHAAALDRLGSVKGGRFSHGKFPGGGQFGIVTVDDHGDHITVEISGRSWTGATIIEHSFTVSPQPSSTPRTS